MPEALPDDRPVFVARLVPRRVKNAAIRGGERGLPLDWSRSDIAAPSGTDRPKISVGFGERRQLGSTHRERRELTCRMVDLNALAEVPDL
jgi:hypothetical protein